MNKRKDTPMLIIINDVDSCNTGIDTFNMLIDKLNNLGYTFTYRKKDFRRRIIIIILNSMIQIEPFMLYTMTSSKNIV